MGPIAIMAGAEDARWLDSLGLDVTEDGAAASVIIASATHVEQAAACARATPLVLIGDPAAHIDPRATHVIRRGLPGELVRLLVHALGAHDREPDAAVATTGDEARAVQRAFAFSRKLAAATDLKQLEALALHATLELVDADRGTCQFLDGEGGLWRQAQRGDPYADGRARCGLAGFAARTRTQVVAERVDRDLRWVASVDDPPGDGTERLVAQPVVGASGFVHAVLVAVRPGRRLAFTGADLACLRRFAALLAPFFDQVTAHAAEQALIQGETIGRLFRSEAIAAASAPQRGQVIRLAPAWISWAYWLLAALFVAGALFVTLGTVTVYSTGAATIRATAKTDVSARTSGNVVAIAVRPGDPIEAGAVIAQLDDQPQRAALERIEREMAAELRNHMLVPGDSGSEQAVRQLRLTRDAARTALEERIVRSADRGIVSDLRIRVGQRIEPGEVVASTVDGDGPLEVVALLPGSDRPQLAPGMAMRLEIAGYRYAYQALVIESVSSDVIGPSAARRVLGAELESLPVTGPVVLVRGRLPRATFAVDDQRYHFHDGMQATAAVSVRSERILFTLIPGLRRL
jgi:membrane fusion protein (multidrug efflux system)